jgi:hypothetical protein
LLAKQQFKQSTDSEHTQIPMPEFCDLLRLPAVVSGDSHWINRLKHIFHSASSLVRGSYHALKRRHGPRYTNAMLLGVFLALFFPVPGTSLAVIGLIVAIAEVHRLVSRRGHRMLEPLAFQFSRHTMRPSAKASQKDAATPSN